MGYTTEFDGRVEIEPPLNQDEISFLKLFSNTRRMARGHGPLFVAGSGFMGQGSDPDIYDYNTSHPDQPGLWCQWEPTDDGRFLEWNGSEKFYHADLWMKYIVHMLLGPEAKEYVAAHVNEDDRLQYFTCDHIMNGEIRAEGESQGDVWILNVKDNLVTIER